MAEGKTERKIIQVTSKKWRRSKPVGWWWEQTCMAVALTKWGRQEKRIFWKHFPFRGEWNITVSKRQWGARWRYENGTTPEIILEGSGPKCRLHFLLCNLDIWPTWRYSVGHHSLCFFVPLALFDSIYLCLCSNLFKCVFYGSALVRINWDKHQLTNPDYYVIFIYIVKTKPSGAST